MKKGFKVGDRLVWESQSKGNWTKKDGVVCAVIPKGGDSMAYFRRVAEPNDRAKFVNGERDHQSYLLRVGPQGGGKVCKIYWPLVQYFQSKRNPRR